MQLTRKQSLISGVMLFLGFVFVSLLVINPKTALAKTRGGYGHSETKTEEAQEKYRLNLYMQFGDLFSRDTQRYPEVYIESAVGGVGFGIEGAIYNEGDTTLGIAGALDFYGFGTWNCGWPTCTGKVWSLKLGGFWHYKFDQFAGFHLQPSLIAVNLSTTRAVEEDEYTATMDGGGFEIDTAITFGESVRFQVGPYYQKGVLVRKDGEHMRYDNYGARIGISIPL